MSVIKEPVVDKFEASYLVLDEDGAKAIEELEGRDDVTLNQ